MVAVLSQISFPVARSKQYTLNSRFGGPCAGFSPTGCAPETKIRSSQTIGVEIPRPGIATFHLTFFVVFHSIGGFAVEEEPLPVGPRQLFQFSAFANELRKEIARTRNTICRGIEGTPIDRTEICRCCRGIRIALSAKCNIATPQRKSSLTMWAPDTGESVKVSSRP